MYFLQSALNQINVAEGNRCRSAQCILRKIEESDLVFFACSAYPPDSQSTPNCVRRYIYQRNKFDGTRNSKVV